MRLCHECRVYNCEQARRVLGVARGSCCSPGIFVNFFLVLEIEESAAVDAGERGGTGQPAGEMTVDSCLVFGWEGEQRGQHELGRSKVELSATR